MAGMYVNVLASTLKYLNGLNHLIVSCLRPISLTKPHLLSYL